MIWVDGYNNHKVTAPKERIMAALGLLISLIKIQGFNPNGCHLQHYLKGKDCLLFNTT